MSSFVIAKKDYCTAAGVVAALADNKKLWYYDYAARRNSTKEDYFTRFCECYEMNALSVVEQYDDPDMQGTPEDEKECAAAFEKAYSKMKTGLIGFGGSGFNLRQVISNLLHFFSSACYQTEKEAYYFKMKMYFDGLTAEITRKYLLPDSECWGEFEI